MTKRHIIGAALLLTATACSSDKIVLEVEYSPNQTPRETKMVIEGGKWVQKHEVCTQTVRITNNSKHRLKSLKTSVASFYDIGSGKNEGYSSELPKDPSCSEIKARKIEIIECSIDGLPEGECINLVKIKSN